MGKKQWSLQEIQLAFDVGEAFILDLEREEIICSTCQEGGSPRMFAAAEVEKVRMAKVLVEEMEVNLPGVEVILRMRQNMTEMKRQFDAVLEALLKELQDGLKVTSKPD